MSTDILTQLRRAGQYLLFQLSRLFLNGNAKKLQNALTETRRLKASLENFDRSRQSASIETCDKFYREWLKSAEKVEDELGNLLTIIFGFSYLREQIVEVNRWYADEENINRLRDAENNG